MSCWSLGSFRESQGTHLGKPRQVPMKFQLRGDVPPLTQSEEPFPESNPYASSFHKPQIQEQTRNIPLCFTSRWPLLLDEMSRPFNMQGQVLAKRCLTPPPKTQQNNNGIVFVQDFSLPRQKQQISLPEFLDFVLLRKTILVAHKKSGLLCWPIHSIGSDKSTNQPINQSTNHPINQSTNQPISQSTNQPINQSTNQ